MQLHTLHRDGPARINEWTLQQKKVTTPAILFIHTSRYAAPPFADVLIANNTMKNTKKPMINIHSNVFSPQRTKKMDDLAISLSLQYPKDMPLNIHHRTIHNKKNKQVWSVIPGNHEAIDEAVKGTTATVFIIADAAQLFSQPTNFITYITKLRTQIGYQKLIYLPSIGEPKNLALLAYLGVDLTDSFSAIQETRNHRLLFTTGSISTYEIDELPCSCPICITIHGHPKTMTTHQILHHNYHALTTEQKQVRNAITQGNLRELIETRVRTDPHLTTLLRTYERNHYAYLEERIPITRKSPLLATTTDSLQRPEIHRFQERIIAQYRKPPSAKILLLLPCSAKKPYSFSHSHHLFRDQLFSQQNPSVVHEVILTSPLGLVPRELELIYPASAYDIPVTGIWDEDEKKMIRTLLTQYLTHNSYESAIIHLPPTVQEFIADLFTKPTITSIQSPTADESLQQLSTTLHTITQSYDPVATSQRTLENITALATYQFGKTPGEQLLEHCQIKGKYPYQKIIHHNTQIGMITRERGLISLTLNGAARLLDSGKHWVSIYNDFPLKGSLLAPGIHDADTGIRIGDEVIILRDKTLCAVGVAQMNGAEMKESTWGEAVKIRHTIPE